MLKTLAAIGLGAALALSPLAAFAGDTAAPAASDSTAKAPMKKKTHTAHKSHKTKHHMKSKSKMAPAPAEEPKG